MSKTIDSLTPLEISKIIEELKITKFPLELADKNIKISIQTMPRRFRKNTFFQVRPKMNVSLLKPSTKRHYQIEINPALYTNNPGREAIRSILMHELQHVVDFTNKDFFELASFAYKYERNKAFRFQYERETDLHALKRGAGVGLANYRLWLYEQIKKEKDLEEKKRMYMTPEEIYIYLSVIENVRCKNIFIEN
ncbi:MAG: hypothetical protein QE271_10425 [Bacteriovoracaceae bacterium]|nr:hypothetical protein [Bacteriovoracaceae bacterium]